MAENKENDERKAQIAEINKHIRDGINQWADIMLTADADQWAYDLTYFPRDLMNATLIFQHVASNIGIKATASTRSGPPNSDSGSGSWSST